MIEIKTTPQLGFLDFIRNRHVICPNCAFENKYEVGANGVVFGNGVPTACRLCNTELPNAEQLIKNVGSRLAYHINQI